jgi:hypothetical protein
MNKWLDELYTIKYYEDEIRLHPSNCLIPELCKCSDTKCAYTADEAKTLLIKYYQKRIDTLENLTTEEFLLDQGFYF